MTDINRLEQIQYRAAKLVTGALHHTSKIILNVELGWESLQVRYERLGLSLIHKIHLGQTRPLVKKFMPEIQIKQHKTRLSCKYQSFPSVNK